MKFKVTVKELLKCEGITLSNEIIAYDSPETIKLEGEPIIKIDKLKSTKKRGEVLILVINKRGDNNYGCGGFEDINQIIKTESSPFNGCFGQTGGTVQDIAEMMETYFKRNNKKEEITEELSLECNNIYGDCYKRKKGSSTSGYCSCNRIIKEIDTEKIMRQELVCNVKGRLLFTCIDKINEIVKSLSKKI